MVSNGRDNRSAQRRNGRRLRPDSYPKPNSGPEAGSTNFDPDELVGFLLRQLVADEGRLRSALSANKYTTHDERLIAGMSVWINQEHSIAPSPDTVQETRFLLAELHAKREILDLWGTASGDSMPDFFGGYESALRSVYIIMAKPYANRVGFRPEWQGPPNFE